MRDQAPGKEVRIRGTVDGRGGELTAPEMEGTCAAAVRKDTEGNSIRVGWRFCGDAL